MSKGCLVILGPKSYSKRLEPIYVNDTTAFSSRTLSLGWFKLHSLLLLSVPTCRVRLCKDCFSGLTPRDLAPRATFHDSKHQISGVFLEETRRRLLTVGRDRVIKVWDLPAGVF